jgi:hypothetical protein
MTVPDNGGGPHIVDEGDPLKAHERAAVVACAA